MRVCLMIEGQEDVSWAEWRALARACEDSGLEGLFRSDHYLSVQGHGERGSLDAWTTLAGLAAVTQRIRLGTLVSPVTFRFPSLLAKSVTTVDHISGGRAEVGVGAGWFDGEHRAYGFPFPPTGERMEMLAEQLEIVHRHWSEGPTDFEGRHYRVEGMNALPKSIQQPHPTLIVGGIGGPRSLALAVRWADEYNTVYLSSPQCAELRQRASDACLRADRDPRSLTLSLMTGAVIGHDEADVGRRAELIMNQGGQSGAAADWLAGVRDTWVVGTAAQAAARLRDFEAAGVDRVMLQLQNHRDVEMVHIVGEQVATEVR